jgi:hypothetical protein
MIEHFSKWLELVLLLDHSNERAAYAFLDRMFNRFGALTKVLIGQGIKFCGDFQKLYEEALIDHRTTSQNHPKVDKLAE